MKKYLTKQRRYFILLINLCVTASWGQTVVQTIAFADSSFKQQQHHLAIKEYQRALLFCENNRKQYVYRKIAESYFYINQFDKAIDYYDYSFGMTNNDSIKNELLFCKAFCFIQDKNYDFAMVELFSISDSLSKEMQAKYNFFMAVCYYGKSDYKSAEEYFVQSIPSSDTKGISAIHDIFKDKKNYQRPSPRAAKIMSFIVPGAGQIYAGDFKNSINSLLLTGGLAALFIHVSLSYTFIDALIGVGPWIQRYYQGGLTKAEKIARVKLEQRRSNTFDSIVEIVMSKK